jgi:SAM-dependent MidA family methyltransferase
VLAERLRARVAAEGPLSFDDFMAACLYDPQEGYFAAGSLRSARDGDFLTSPEVSPWFGRTLARFVAGERERCGATEIVEVGAGSGSLLGPLVDALGEDYGVRAVEASPVARQALAAVLAPSRVSASLDDADDIGVVIANELLDNLPVALAVRSGGGWLERRVDAGRDGFQFVDGPPSRDLADWCDAFAGPMPDGGLVEVQLAATRWVEDVVNRIDVGALIAVDYGGTAEELAPRRREGTLRTYRAHHLGPEPLLEPGATDITVDVNFTAMAAAARSGGASVELLRQDDFLVEWGLRDVVRELREQELALATSGDAMERLAVRSERTDAETLLHPRGLGDFRVMVARVG